MTKDDAQKHLGRTSPSQFAGRSFPVMDAIIMAASNPLSGKIYLCPWFPCKETIIFDSLSDKELSVLMIDDSRRLVIIYDYKSTSSCKKKVFDPLQ